MARLLARSSRAFISGSLGALSPDTPTVFTVVRDAVARDEDEYEAVRRTLAVMVKQKFATIDGEGDTATYKLTTSGVNLLSEMAGA